MASRAPGALIALVLGVQLAGSATAGGRADPRRAQAERLVAEGRCAAALEILAELRRDDPEDVETLRSIAACEIDEKRFGAAIETLSAASALRPDDGEIRLQLAISLYHEDEIDRAEVELDAAARSLGEDGAEIALYRGLILLARAQPGGAAEGAAWLERARDLGGQSVEPVASYYAGVGWATAQDREHARAALTRVVDEWPGTEWAAQAQRRLDELGAHARRWWASLRGGMEYDSNAVLQGQGVPLPSEISSKRDWRGVWNGQVGSDLFRTESWAAGAAFNYWASAYLNITSFDTQYPGLAIWLDRNLGDAMTLRLAADGGYAWVDYEPFYYTERASLSLLRSWATAGSSELFARFWRDNYLKISPDVPGGPGVPGDPCVPPPGSIPYCGPPGLDEHVARNRDGNGTSFGVLHTVRLPIDLPYGGATGRIGYQYDRFISRGSEYTYQAHSIAAGLRVGLPLQVALDVSGSFTYRPFRNATTFPDQPLFYNVEYGLPSNRRREESYAADVALERPLNDWLTASLRWHFEATHSTAQAFDYDRQIFGAYLTAAFGD